MEANAKAEPKPEIAEDAELAAAAEAALAEHGGDALATVKALLAANTYLEKARDRAIDLVSRGFTRGRLKDPKGSQ